MKPIIKPATKPMTRPDPSAAEYYAYCLTHTRTECAKHFGICQGYVSKSLRRHAIKHGLPLIPDGRVKTTKGK